VNAPLEKGEVTMDKNQMKTFKIVYQGFSILERKIQRGNFQ
jgi:hypothetical protein